MKKLLLWSFFLVLSYSAFGQKSIENSARKETKHYVKVLDLNEDQTYKIEAVFVNKFNSLHDIAELEKSNPDQFRTKRRAIYTGTDQSIRLILTRTQIDLFDVEKRRQRLANAKQIEKLQKQGADKEDILDAQYGIKN